MSKKTLLPAEPRIVVVREQRVILDADLAEMYGVATKRFNEAFKRNRHRFPGDFAFQLTTEEFADLQSRSVSSTWQEPDPERLAPSRPQIATLKLGRGQHRKYRPWVFTEHGALMAANILRSARAVEMSVHVVRAFVRQREQLASSAELLQKLELIDHRLLEHDQALVIVWNKIKELARPNPPPLPMKPKPRLGFHP